MQVDFDGVIAELVRDLEGCTSDVARLGCALGHSLKLVNVDRGFVLLHDIGVDQVVASHNLDEETLWTTADVSQTIIRRTLDSGQPIISDNAMTDERFESSNSILLSSLRAVMCLPFLVRGRTVGILYLDNRFRRGQFNQKQLDAVSKLVSTVSESLVELAAGPHREPRQGGG